MTRRLLSVLVSRDNQQSGPAQSPIKAFQSSGALSVTDLQGTMHSLIPSTCPKAAASVPNSLQTKVWRLFVSKKKIKEVLNDRGEVC